MNNCTYGPGQFKTQPLLGWLQQFKKDLCQNGWALFVLIMEVLASDYMKKKPTTKEYVTNF